MGFGLLQPSLFFVIAPSNRRFVAPLCRLLVLPTHDWVASVQTPLGPRHECGGNNTLTWYEPNDDHDYDDHNQDHHDYGANADYADYDN